MEESVLERIVNHDPTISIEIADAFSAHFLHMAETFFGLTQSNAIIIYYPLIENMCEELRLTADKDLLASFKDDTPKYIKKYYQDNLKYIISNRKKNNFTV